MTTIDGTDNTLTCSRCGTTGPDRNDWTGVYEGGRMVTLLCANCQTPEQAAEATMNEATLRYTTDAFGRLIGKPKS